MKTPPPPCLSSSSSRGEIRIAALIAGFVVLPVMLPQTIAAIDPAPKDHVLFVGTDLSVEQKDGQFYHVIGATKKALKIEKKNGVVEVGLREGANIRINKGVKLSNLTAVISNLRTESEDRASARAQLAAMQASMLLENEAADREDRKHGLVTVLSGVGINQDSPSYKIFKETIEAPAIKDYTESLTGVEQARASAHSFAIEAFAMAAPTDDELTLDASALPHLQLLENPSSSSLRLRDAPSSSIAVDLGFTVSSPVPLDHAYLVVVANYVSPNNPTEVARQISAREFARIDSKPQQVKLTHAASLNGLPFRKFDIALFANGQEVATNLSEKRLELTSDQAFQFFLIEYLSRHKGATLPPTPVLMTPRSEFRRQVGSTDTSQAIYATVDKSGKVLSLSTDSAGSQNLAASVQAALHNVRFMPALDKGSPVDGRLKVTLAQLANN